MQSYKQSSDSSSFFSPENRHGKKTCAHRARTIREAFGLALHELRTKRELSIADLAQLVQYKPIAIELMEREMHETSLTNLIKLAEALKISPTSLMAQIEQYLYPQAGAPAGPDPSPAPEQPRMSPHFSFIPIPVLTLNN